MDAIPETTQAAVRALGRQIDLAKRLNVSPQAISKWKRTRIPAERVLQVEAATGVSRHDLRPDLYPRDNAA